jgi:hypothetical protein
VKSRTTAVNGNGSGATSSAPDRCQSPENCWPTQLLSTKAKIVPSKRVSGINSFRATCMNSLSNHLVPLY